MEARFTDNHQVQHLGKYNLKDSYTESASDALDENRDSVNANQRTTDVGTTKKNSITCST